jgi:diguanylate cyclase (GGDEF)-like protein
MALTLTPKTLPAALARLDSLPTLPAVAVEVLRLAEDESASAVDLARPIERDPALASKLVKLANSSMFGCGTETTNVRDAVVRLGMKTVKLMALSFSLAKPPTNADRHAEVLSAYWRRSLTLATAGRSLARAARLGCDDEAFLCGLLANIGQLVLLELLPVEYPQLLAGTDRRNPTLAEEQAALGLNRAHVADALLSTWGLPERLRLGAQWALGGATEVEPRRQADARLRAALKLGHLAEQLLSSDGGANALQALLAASAEHGLAEAGVNDALMLLESELREMASLFQLELPPGRNHASILDEARMQIVNASLGAVADLQRERNRAQALESANRELSVAASSDGLTGLANRATFDRFLSEQLLRRAQGGMQKSLGLVMVDVDHFKRVNDTFGHAGGDTVLRGVAQLLKRGMRGNDLAARYGGEEFALVFPEIAPAELAAASARLRAALQSQEFVLDGRRAAVTASFGCAHVTVVDGTLDGSALCEAADRALYRAKQQGRNRVVSAGALEERFSPNADAGTARPEDRPS